MLQFHSSEGFPTEGFSYSTMYESLNCYFDREIKNSSELLKMRLKNQAS